MFYQNRDDTRGMFFKAWAKTLKGEALQPLEQQIVDVITMHPEYHALLAQPEDCAALDFAASQGQSNPFLHMGLHIALQEQLSTDQPQGIRDIYQQVLRKSTDRHQCEHRIMECLAQAIWEAQQHQQPPDLTSYLACLRNLA